MTEEEYLKRMGAVTNPSPTTDTYTHNNPNYYTAPTLTATPTEPVLTPVTFEVEGGGRMRVMYDDVSVQDDAGVLVLTTRRSANRAVFEPPVYSEKTKSKPLTINVPGYPPLHGYNFFPALVKCMDYDLTIILLVDKEDN